MFIILEEFPVALVQTPVAGPDPTLFSLLIKWKRLKGQHNSPQPEGSARMAKTFCLLI